MLMMSLSNEEDSLNCKHWVKSTFAIENSCLRFYLYRVVTHLEWLLQKIIATNVHCFESNWMSEQLMPDVASNLALILEDLFDICIYEAYI